MHVPDGFLDVPTSVATGAVAAAGVGLALRGAKRELDDRTAPMAGLVATFVFAAQMLNFPVGVGTSGHLLGGALAAILVGPWTAILCLAVVLIVQSLLFADGGITALGTNITLLAIVGVAVGWLVFRGLQAVLPRRLGLVAPLAAVAGYISVPLTAVAFVGLYALGGQAPVSLSGLASAMVGWHAVIGIGEAAISGLVVGSVIAVRPDLVYGARRVLASRDLEIRPDVSGAARPEPDAVSPNSGGVA
jgi:cobalt/nickel transport system permease protein